VTPSDYQVVATTRDDVAVITLVSCHPAWSAAQRIIISAELDVEASDQVTRPIGYATPPDTERTGLPGEEFTTTSTTIATTTTPVTTSVAGPSVETPRPPDVAVGIAAEDAFGRGWFHDDEAYVPIALWGLLLTLISVGSYLVSRRFRRDLVGFAIGVAPFATSAFYFFQNLNRLLPPSL
jgi:sortase A